VGFSTRAVPYLVSSRLFCCTAGEPGLEADANLDAAQLQAALDMLQEELAGSHAEAAMLSKQASGIYGFRAVLRIAVLLLAVHSIRSRPLC